MICRGCGWELIVEVIGVGFRWLCVCRVIGVLFGVGIVVNCLIIFLKLIYFRWELMFGFVCVYRLW